MNSFLINISSAVISAVIISWLGLNKSKHQVVIVNTERVSWFWKLLLLIGKFLFFYGLIVFLANLVAIGIEGFNTRLGLSILMFGIIFFLSSRFVIYFKS